MAACCTAMARIERPGLAWRAGMAAAGSAACISGVAAQASALAPPGLAPPGLPPRLGQAIDGAAAARLDGTVFPDGRGLPPGRGTVSAGLALYNTQCSACHGPSGSGGSGGKLAGGGPLPGSARADKTIGQFWPFATTVFDYLRRAMPLQAPGSLSDDDSYALTAYLLHLNGLLDADAALDAQRLPAIRMPNRDGFVTAPRDGPRWPQGLAPP